MASIRILFDTLMDLPLGNKLCVELENVTDYETVRTRLVKLWNKHREILLSITDEDPFLNNSLCANWQKERGQGEFFIGKARRKPGKSFSFSISGGESTATGETVGEGFAPNPAPTSEEEALAELMELETDYVAYSGK